MKFNANLPSINIEREGCAAAAQGGKIFVMGGTGEDWDVPLRTAEMYDIATQQWTTIAPMSTARDNGAVVSLGDKIIVMGGRDDLEFLSSVEQYDPISDQWTSLPPMNEERSPCDAAVVDGKIIVVGGFDDGSLCEEFDPDTQEWSEIPPMHFKRCGCAAAVLDGQLYVMGGYDRNYMEPNTAHLSSAEVYNPATRQWTIINDMTTPRCDCAAVSLGGRIVVVGGRNGNDDTVCSCESYNPATQRWSSMPSLNTKRWGCAAVEVEGNIYVLGGYDGMNVLSSMEYLPFFVCLLDEQPNLAKDLNIDDTIMPSFLSFVGRHCKMRMMWRVIRSRQDLLTF